MSVETQDAFQKELIDVFVQEAQEWLQQIHVALDELQQAPPPDRHRVLAETIKNGVANLGGTAATINLSDVERASFAALPFVDAVQDPAADISVGDFVALCRQLGHIHTALTGATGVAFDAASGGTAVAQPPTTIRTCDYVALLQGVQGQESYAGPSPRNLRAALVAQAEGLMQRGVEQCDLASIKQFLDQSAEGDQGFLQTLHQHLPHVVQVLQRLQQAAEGASQIPAEVAGTVERVAQLLSIAQQVNALPATTFFMGLHNFFLIVAQHRVSLTAQNYEAVNLKLRDCVKTIVEWAEHGRVERAAIQRALCI